jgi:hypothetical protein
LLAEAARSASSAFDDGEVSISTQAHLVAIRVIWIERLLASFPNHAGTGTDCVDAGGELACQLVVRNHDA